jgi:hypothetical protein
VRKQVVTEWARSSERNRTDRTKKKSMKIWTSMKKEWTRGKIRLSSNWEKNEKNKHFNFFIFHWHIKIAFISSAISPQTVGGIVAKVSQTMFSIVMKIPRGDTDSGKILYIVYRSQANKTRFYFYSISIYLMYSLHSFSFKNDTIVDVFIEMFFAAHYKKI